MILKDPKVEATERLLRSLSDEERERLVRAMARLLIEDREAQAALAELRSFK